VASLTEDDAIRPMGPASFRVRRGEIERLVSSGELLSLRAIPHQDADGVIDGYRIYGVRDGSPAARLGVQNGDTVVSLNGQPLTDVTLALDALAGIGTATSASIGVVRRGQPLRLDYQLD
jgi:general secretion pathway protein C